ncbi:MAG: tetratricopeptide repeat protein [Thermodesulfobacteriota bacterium]|nr:tetratricopeptide repeat protein [Thermodesulfobacteriota bacterium]
MSLLIIFKKRLFLSLPVMFFIVAGGLSGCATQQQNQRGDLSAQEMPGSEIERLGDVYYNQGNYALALVQYNKFLRRNPDNNRVHYKKGLLLLKGRLDQEAIREFKVVIKKDSTHALAFQGLGQAYFRLKKYEDAIKHLSKAVEIDSTLWKAHNLLGIIYDYQGKYELAVREYNNAITLKPRDGLLYNNLGMSYALLEEYDKSVRSFNTALKFNASEAKIYNNLGLVLSKLGKYRLAMEAFKKGGDEAQAYNNLGFAYMQKGEREKAINSFEKAIESKPTFYLKASENLKKAKMDCEDEPSTKPGGKSL